MDSSGKSSIRVINKDVDIVKAIRDLTISGEQECSFYIYNINDIIKKYTTWIREMPTVTPYYAVKCNNHPAVLQVLAALGTGFDCASKSEVEQVLSLGISPARIIFANPTKVSSHISYAAKFEVNLMTFDSELELYKMKELCPNVQAVIRIRYDDPSAQVLLGSKFGCSPNDEAPYLLRLAKKIGVNVVGVSFHVGSGCQNPEIFGPAIAACKHVFNVSRNIDFDFTLIDIGGGFLGKSDNSIKRFAEVINGALKKHFSAESVQIISEPGTYFVESTFTLACNVHSIRQLDTLDPVTGKKSTKFMYYLNDGIFCSFSTVISMDAIRIPITVKHLKRITNDVYLPKLECDEWIFFPNMGAYTLTIASSYNGFEKPDIYQIIDNENCLLLENKLSFIAQNKCNLNSLVCNEDSPEEKEQSTYSLGAEP